MTLPYLDGLEDFEINGAQAEVVRKLINSLTHQRVRSDMSVVVAGVFDDDSYGSPNLFNIDTVKEYRFPDRDIDTSDVYINIAVRIPADERSKELNKVIEHVVEENCRDRELARKQRISAQITSLKSQQRDIESELSRLETEL